MRGGLIPLGLRFRLHSLNRGLFNPTLLRRRGFDAHIISMQQSGTHWLKFMLGHVLAGAYGVPPPAGLEDNSVIGHPKSPPIHAGIPRIVQSHSIPHYFMRSRLLMRTLHFPRYIVLVRDIRESLVSHYEKWKDVYKVDFATYLRTRPGRRTFRNDVWLRIRFFNEAGTLARRHPDRVLVVRYEDLRADTVGELGRIARFLGIEGATPLVLAAAVAASTKSEMARRMKAGEGSPAIVRDDARPARAWYAPEDRRFLDDLFRRYLRHSFGYADG